MMGPEERELFTKGIRAATASASGLDLDVALDVLGWRDALALDPRTTTATLFEQQGAACRTSSALDVVLTTALGVDDSTGVVLPPLQSVEVPGRVGGGALVVDGLATSALATREHAIVVADDGVHIVETSALTLTPITGIDPRLGLVNVAASNDSVASCAADWRGAVAAGQRAIAHELVGASRAMLQLAREHAVDRVQFDRPIAGFQAVRHRLAECFVAIEAADAAASAAWDDASPLTAAMAKAIAGRSARTVARHSQQVLAGIGFTTEHPLHHHVRRVLVLDHLLGDTRSLTATLGTQLLQDRSLPNLLPL
jgi:hypothetical protein